MGLYKYRAVDQRGEPYEGTMEEESSGRVTAILAERGLQVSSVESLTKDKSLLRPAPLRWEDLNLLSDQLLTVAKSGLPFAPAFSALAKDLRSRRLKPLVESVGAKLDAGNSLEEALSEYSGRLPPVYVSMIRAGERTGNLTHVLGILSSYSTRMLDIKYGVQMALAYPAMVFVAGCGIVYFLLVKVLPIFAEIFEEFGSGLPAPTQLWMDLSDFVTTFDSSFFMVLCVFLLGLTITYKLLRRSASGSVGIEWCKEGLPIIGAVYRAATLARFCKALGLLLSSRVPVLESLDLASAASGNARLKKHVQDASVLVANGERVGNALADTGYFPHAFCWFLSNGEDRGQVPETLLTMSESYDREVLSRDRLLVQMISPWLIVFFGMIIGFLMVSMYLPIFTLGDAISG